MEDKQKNEGEFNLKEREEGSRDNESGIGAQCWNVIGDHQSQPAKDAVCGTGHSGVEQHGSAILKKRKKGDIR